MQAQPSEGVGLDDVDAQMYVAQVQVRVASLKAQQALGDPTVYTEQLLTTVLELGFPSVPQMQIPTLSEPTGTALQMILAGAVPPQAPPPVMPSAGVSAATHRASEGLGIDRPHATHWRRAVPERGDRQLFGMPRAASTSDQPRPARRSRSGPVDDRASRS